MISALLGRELGTRLFGDEAPKRADLPLELAGRVVRLYPVCDTLDRQARWNVSYRAFGDGGGHAGE